MVRPRDAGAITHQPTRVGILSPRITCGYGVVCRERHELNTPLREERVGTDQEVIRPLLDSGDGRRLEVPLRADLEENHLLSGYAHRVFDVFRLKFVSGIAWIDEHSDPRGTGQQLFKELQPLRQQIRSVQSHAGGIAARPVKAGHEAIAAWITAHN